MPYTDDEIDDIFQQVAELSAATEEVITGFYRWMFALTGAVVGLVVGALIMGIVRWLS